MMRGHFPLWFQEKLSAILATVIGAITLYFANVYHNQSLEYVPLPQQVLLDSYHRPIGVQNLLEDTFHNPHYRTGNQGEPGADFAKEKLLDLFTYNKDDLTSGKVLSRFRDAFSEGKGEEVYQRIFVNLSSPRIVMAQDAIVRARVIGNLEYNGEATLPYETISGLPLESKSFQYTGKMMMTVHAESTFPTLYDVVIEVQRALLQDKILGYQIIRMELK